MEKLSVIFVVLWFSICSQTVLGTKYVVGDSNGWTTGVNYTSWTLGKSFFVGDILYFDYLKDDHDVLQVDYKVYHSCNVTSTIASYKSGGTAIELYNTGIYYFVCGMPNHCFEGQRLQVFVYLQNTITNTSVPNNHLPSVSTPSPSLNSSSRAFFFYEILATIGLFVLVTFTTLFHI